MFVKKDLLLLMTLNALSPFSPFTTRLMNYLTLQLSAILHLIVMLSGIDAVHLRTTTVFSMVYDIIAFASITPFHLIFALVGSKFAFTTMVNVLRVAAAIVMVTKLPIAGKFSVLTVMALAIWRVIASVQCTVVFVKVAHTLLIFVPSLDIAFALHLKKLTK